MVRPVRSEDRAAVRHLLLYEKYSHRHMDWKMPLDWLGSKPYLLAMKFNQPAAVIACPPDPPENAWIRAFAAGGLIDHRRAWELLWNRARESISRYPRIERALTIVMEDWYRELLTGSGFVQRSEIRMLSWENGLKPLAEPAADVPIRAMQVDDLAAVAELDRAAFYPIWHHSLEMLRLAREQSVFSTVSEGPDGITGYSISTPSPFGGHLARLAVRPGMQGQGVGYAILHDLLARFRARGALRVTVNTQSDNSASLNLYRKANFHPTGERYAILEYAFH